MLFARSISNLIGQIRELDEMKQQAVAREYIRQNEIAAQRLRSAKEKAKTITLTRINDGVYK